MRSRDGLLERAGLGRREACALQIRDLAYRDRGDSGETDGDEGGGWEGMAMDAEREGRE